MNKVAERAQFGEQAFGQHRNPFGAITYASEHAPTLTVPDAVRRCRWIAVDINATSFGLFQICSPSERQMLSPCFDSAYPHITDETKLIGRADISALVNHIRTSTAPCCWNDGRVGSDALQGIEWCKRIEPLVAGTSGMAFPVHAERKSGIVVFFGPDIRLDSHALFEIHARCFSLFEAATRIRRNQSEDIPSVSKRELECLKLTANGYTSEEIARLLKLSVHTANQYLTNTTQKLNAMNRMHAVAKALRMGLID